MSTAADKLFVTLQRLLPKHLLTALVYRLARVRTPAVKNLLIRKFIGQYRIDVDEVRGAIPDDFPTFNDFFIRELVPGARPVDAAADTLVSPADGTVSAAGRIVENRLFQAKGHDYTLTDLLATDTHEARRYTNGSFVTIYLAPFNYHRVHAPLAAEIASVRYVPGTLFSVNDATVRQLPNLFARNERVVCHMDTASGPAVLILVGAMNVGTIHTVWTGDIRPAAGGVVRQLGVDPDSPCRALDKGDLVGWFNMGSTVILLLPPGAGGGLEGLQPGQRLLMGEAIGRLERP